MSTAARNQRTYEENLAKGSDNELQDVPRKLFRDKAAENEYRRILKNHQDQDMVGNLDRNNMILCANLWSEYCENLQKQKKYAREEKKAADLEERKLILEMLGTLQDREPRLVDKILAVEGKLGMTMDSRLKAAASKAQQQEEELKAAFGDI